MKPGSLCLTNQELALGSISNIEFEICKKGQSLSSVWKSKTIGLIESKNYISLFVIHSQGTGWISYEKDQSLHSSPLIVSNVE